MIETKAMIRGFRHVPQYDDMFAEIFKTTPARASDRTALELYESPAYAFIGRPFAQMSAFHLRNLMGAQKEMGMHMTAMREGRPHVEVMAESGDPPSQPPGGGAMGVGAVAQVIDPPSVILSDSGPPAPGQPPAPAPEGNRVIGAAPGEGISVSLDSRGGAPPPSGKGFVKNIAQ